MSAVREAVNDKANALAEAIEQLRREVDDKKALSFADATRLQDMELDLAELRAFLNSGDDTNG